MSERICAYPECDSAPKNWRAKRCTEHMQSCIAPGCARGSHQDKAYCGMHIYRVGQHGSLEPYAWRLAPDGFKVCTKCRKTKPRSDFYRQPGSPDGLKPHCTPCVRATQQTYDVANRERQHAYYRANADRAAKANRAWRSANPDRVRAARKRWADANPGHEAHRRRLRRARLSDVLTLRFTPAQLAQRMSMFKGCWMCGDPSAAEVDHVKPIAARGAHILANFRPACRECNLRKGGTWPYSVAETGDPEVA